MAKKEQESLRLISKIATDLKLMLRRPPRQQYAAISYRENSETQQPEVLLLTSRDTGRWVIPKGWPMEGKQAHAVAQQEAFEEAGVRGHANHDAFGYFTYDKKLKNDVVVECLVQVHLLKVDKIETHFPEMHSRIFAWVSPSEAAIRVNEPELKSLFNRFAKEYARLKSASL